MTAPMPIEPGWKAGPWSRREPTVALVALSLCAALSSLGTSIANVGLPTLADAFAVPMARVQWVVLAYLLAVTALIVSAGRLGDLIGRRRMLMAGVILFSASSALCALAPSLELLVAARAAQGLGAAAMMALSLALVGDSVPADRTGRAMGLMGSMSAVGTALGPTLGGLLIGAFGWRAMFLATVPLGLVSAFLVHRSIAGEPEPRPEAAAFDGLGTLLLALTLGCYAMGMTGLGGSSLGWLAAAALGGALFLLAQRRAPVPLVAMAMLRDETIGPGLAMSAVVMTVMMATLVVGPFFLAGGLGLDATRTGLVMSAGPLVAAVAGVPAGRMVDRLGAAAVTIAGLWAMLAGCLLLAVFPARVGVPAYVASIAVLTLGYALFQAANNTAVMREAGPQGRGAVSGLLNLARNLGLITGASAMGALFALGGAGQSSSGMALTFGVAALLVAAALAVALRGVERGDRGTFRQRQGYDRRV